MKMRKFFSTTFILGAMLVLGAVQAFAQAGVAPASQFGIGAFAGGNITSGGFSVQYAINPSFQLGLALGVNGVSRDGNSATDYSTDLYGRFILEGVVNPFIQAGFRRVSEDVTIGTTTTTSEANQIYGGFGLEYFFNRNVGVFAGFDVVAIVLDPSLTRYGFNNGRVGVEWFFNP